LSIHLINEYPSYYQYFAQKEFKYRTHTFKNLNPLLNATLAVDGLKPGFTEGMGYGMAVSATKDGRRLVAVMNGFESERDRRDDVLKFLSWGFVNFKAYRVFTEGETVGDARVWGGQSWTVPLKTKFEVKILLPVAAKDMRLKAKIVYAGPLKPPVQEGDKVAELRVFSETSGTSNTAPLYAAAPVQPAGMVSKGIDSILLGVNSYVLEAVTRLLKKQQQQLQGQPQLQPQPQPQPQPQSLPRGPIPTARL
jgi:serine-type D-Ala-D-Ala carboxypeptidase (penicillin-binding protein 5/6)